MNLNKVSGVADQVTLLAVELKRYGYDPTVLIYGPVADDNSYLRRLADGGIHYWVVSESAFEGIQRFLRIIHVLGFPGILLDALLRRRSLERSLSGAWGVIRRIGYAALKLFFRLRLVYGKFQLRPALVHIHNCDAWQVIEWVDELGLPIVYTDHSSMLTMTSAWYTDLPRTVWRADAITCVSNSSADSVGHLLQTRLPISVIPNMTPIPAQNALSTHKPRGARCVIGFLSRLAPEKDPETLLKAASIAVKLCPNVEFHIYGSGEMFDAIRQMIRDMGLEDHVYLRDAYRCSDLGTIMKGIDVVTLTSLSEGLPVGLIEAMAYGKPVVATAVGGVPELVQNGITGILAPARDAKALAEGFVSLCGNEDLYMRMAHAARERYLTHFTPEKVVPQYVALYERLVV